MAEFYEVVAEIGKRRMEDRLYKVKKGYHFFWEDEEVIRENDGFLHRCSSFSWKSKYKEPTPFVAVVEEEFTYLKPPFDPCGKYDIYDVQTSKSTGLYLINKDSKDYLTVSTSMFLLAMYELK